jgi:hypothetical protein
MFMVYLTIQRPIQKRPDAPAGDRQAAAGGVEDGQESIKGWTQ